MLDPGHNTPNISRVLLFLPAPTLRLLRAIADDSPGTRKADTPTKTESGSKSKVKSTGKKSKTIDDFFSSQESTRSVEQSKARASGKVKMARRKETYVVLGDGSNNTSTKRKTKTKHGEVTARATAAGSSATRSFASDASDASDADAGPHGEILVFDKLAYQPSQKASGKDREKEKENLPTRRKRTSAVHGSIHRSGRSSSPTSMDTTKASPPFHSAGKRHLTSNTSAAATWAEWERASPPPPPSRRCPPSACTHAPSLVCTCTCKKCATSTSSHAGGADAGDGGAWSVARNLVLQSAAFALSDGDGAGGTAESAIGCNGNGDLGGTDLAVPSAVSNPTSNAVSDTISGRSQVQRVSGSDQTLKKGIGSSSSPSLSPSPSPSPPPVVDLIEVVDLSAVEEEKDEPSGRPRLNTKLKMKRPLAAADEKDRDTDDSCSDDVRIDFCNNVDSNDDDDGDDDDDDDHDQPATPGTPAAGGRGSSFAAEDDDLEGDDLEDDHLVDKLGGKAEAGDASVLSPGFSSQMSAERGAAGAESVGRDGQDGQRKKHEEENLASKLLFAVSFNTGRVHVYKEAEGPGAADGATDAMVDLVDSGGEPDEERQPTHCRLVICFDLVCVRPISAASTMFAFNMLSSRKFPLHGASVSRIIAAPRLYLVLKMRWVKGKKFVHRLYVCTVSIYDYCHGFLL